MEEIYNRFLINGTVQGKAKDRGVVKGGTEDKEMRKSIYGEKNGKKKKLMS